MQLFRGVEVPPPFCGRGTFPDVSRNLQKANVLFGKLDPRVIKISGLIRRCISSGSEKLLVCFPLHTHTCASQSTDLQQSSC